MEYVDRVLQSMLQKEPFSIEFYRRYMLWELENIEEKDRLVEYARHALVMARKPENINLIYG